MITVVETGNKYFRLSLTVYQCGQLTVSCVLVALGSSHSDIQPTTVFTDYITSQDIKARSSLLLPAYVTSDKVSAYSTSDDNKTAAPLLPAYAVSDDDKSTYSALPVKAVDNSTTRVAACVVPDKNKAESYVLPACLEPESAHKPYLQRNDDRKHCGT